LAIVVREQRPLSELASLMKPVPQILKNVKLPHRLPLESMPRLTRLSASVTRRLGKEGRLLVRWSGTEAKLRIMIEGPDLGDLHTWADELAEAAQADATERGSVKNA
jgi:phosphoglucosamine mutase